MHLVFITDYLGNIWPLGFKLPLVIFLKQELQGLNTKYFIQV